MVLTLANGQSIGPVSVCDTFLKRLAGFMFQKGLAAGQALLFPDCRCVHTCFMRADIRVVFLDAHNNVVREIERMRPWRIAWCWQARHTLEIVRG